MKPKKSKKWRFFLACATALTVMTACSQASSNSGSTSSTTTTTSATTTSNKTSKNTTYFTDADYDTSYDESSAAQIKLSGSSATVSGDGVAVSGSTVTISKAGTYVISGQSDGVQIKITASDSDEVHIILNGVTMTGTNTPISATSAKHVYVTLADGTTNSLSDSSSNSDDSEAVLFSKVDMTINGSGTLNVNAKKNNGIKANDTLHITGGTYNITATGDAFNVNDELNITGTTMTIEAGEDAVKVDNDDDTSVGTMYLSENTMTITAGDDGIHASGDMIIDSGTYTVKNSVEGIEGKSITINGGDINVYSTDDGVNATNANASQSEIFFKMTGGTLTVEVGQGDTDPIDSNGDIIVTGGTITLTGQSGFDFDGTATYTGGDITINGEKQTEIVNSMPGGGGGAPQGGGPQGGGFPGGNS